MYDLNLRIRPYKVVREEWGGALRSVEFWGFRTDPVARDEREIAEDFLQQNHALFHIGKDLSTLVRRPRVLRSLGARHVIYQQICEDLIINRAYVTVHMDTKGRVYMAKNRTLPMEMMPTNISFPVSERAARIRALKEFRRAAARSISVPGEGRLPHVEKLLFLRKDKLYPAYRLRLYLERPRAEWIVYINGRRGGVLRTYDNLAKVHARGRVFYPNPVAQFGDRNLLNAARGRKATRLPPEAYRIVPLRGLEKGGKLDGTYVTTEPTKWRVEDPSGEYTYESGQRRFAEVMAYYHIDSAARYLEDLGFEGACRVFGRAIVPDPRGKNLGGSLWVDATGNREDNSWYSPGLGKLTFGCGGVNDAEDGEVILHEFGHALQDAICPDFGQSREAAAMGEGFSDYLAASYFAQKKVAEYRASVITWGIAPERHGSLFLRRVDGDRTYREFRNRADCEHENGTIWSATLWDIWNALGREKADKLIIESHFQLDAFTTFDRGARAILDADQNLYGRRHRGRLLRIFHRRHIEPVR